MVLISVILLAGVTDGSEVIFPPQNYQYTGDYIYITEPGRYTLEHPVTHTYPVGIIISSSSVVLEGQGYQVSPANSDSKQTVGIWIRREDSSGKPVTGVTIKNISITHEGYGVYAEGEDLSGFTWFANQPSDMLTADNAGLPRSLTISEVEISSSGDGITIDNHPDVVISDSIVRTCTGSGIILNESNAWITQSLITGNNEYGLLIRGGNGSELSSSTINQNGNAGVGIEGVTGLRIFNNIFDNPTNLKEISESSGIELSTVKQEGLNIIGGGILGGNYWEGDSSVVPKPEPIPDKNGDGIGDRPYSTGIGVTDSLPLVKPVAKPVLPEEVIVLPSPSLPAPTILPVQTPNSLISGIHAVIVGDTIPAEMVHSQSYPVSLHLLNDGSDDWITQHMVGVTALEEAANFGPKWMPVPISGPVASGKIQTVEFTIRAPSNPGTYTLKYQAAREGSGVEVIYGRAYTRTITVR